MTVSRAYIAGLGTTGVLIGFALLTLAVFSAIIAFRGWPSDAAVDGAGAVSVDSGGRLIELDPLSLAKDAAAAARPAAAGRAVGTAAAVEGGAEAGGVDGVTRSGTTGLGPEADRIGAPGQAAPSPPARPGGAVPVGVPNGAAGAIQTAGEALGQAGAPPGDGLSQAGQGVTDAVRGAGGAVQEKTRLP